MRKSLTRLERVRGRGLIRSLFRSPHKYSCQGVSLRLTMNEFDYSRLLVSPGRKFGNSVQRNYIKRVGREFFRTHKDCIEPGYDLAFIFYSGEYSFQDRCNQMKYLLQKAGIFCTDK